MSAWSLDRTARALLAVFAAWYVGVFLYVAGRRVGFPYEIEWMEGGIYEHVARVLEGKPLYVAPSLDFTPYIYTPLYYWVGAASVALLGPGLPALRAVSLLSTLVVFAALFDLVRHETRDRLCGWVAVGLFAACFHLAGAWFDIARVDMLSLALLMLAAVLFARSERFDALAGVLLGLAFLAKQSALVSALPLIAARVVAQRGLRRVHAGVACGAVVGFSTLALDRASSGWYRFYTFELPASHPVVDWAKRGFWESDLFSVLPFATVAVVFVLAQPQPWRSALARLAFAGGLLASAWSGRLHSGGYVNVLLPAFLALSWAFGVALHAWTAEADRARPAAFARFGYAICVLQLAWLWQLPGRQIPSTAALRKGNALVAALREAPGEVLLPFHGHIARLAGKAPHGHEMAFHDIQLGTSDRAKRSLHDSVTSTLRDRRYALIVLDEPWWKGALEKSYERTDHERWFDAGTLRSLTGNDTFLRHVYVPK